MDFDLVLYCTPRLLSDIVESATLHSGPVDVSLPGMARRAIYSANIYTDFHTADIMPRTSEELGA